ncbi:hypothetical protein NE865_15759 [Phthorimaea operculella]|nr:hypothetical protein NE865_15759 [Phthorimaea operculella]
MNTQPVIKYFLLNKDELTYEILIRGIEPASNVIELKRQIAKIVPTLPSQDIGESGLDVTTDLSEVTNSVKELAGRIKSLEEKFEQSPFERARALGAHIFYRLNRITATDASSTASYNSVPTTFKTLFAKLNALKKEPEPSQPQTSTAGNLPTIVVNCDHGVDTKIPHFNGDGWKAKHWFRSIKDTINTWAELEKQLIADFSLFDHDYRLLKEINSRTQGESENIVIYLAIMSQMFARLIDPISEKEQLQILLHNIRPCYANVLSSNSASTESISELRSVCQNYEKIKCMTSQFHEPPKISENTIAPDLAFNCSHEDRNKFAKKNYNPNYNKYNSSYNKYNSSYKNYNSNFNRDNANRNGSSNQSQPFKNNKQNVNGTNDKYNKPFERNPHSHSSPVASIQSNNGPKFCPRCRSSSHSLYECRQDRYPICFKCGKKNVTYPNCPVCQANNSKN